MGSPRSFRMHCDKSRELPDFIGSFIPEMLETAIGEGNADAMNDLGAIFYDGARGFEQSFEKALYYYDMAASIFSTDNWRQAS